AEQFPVRRAGRGSAKTSGIDERFREINGVAVYQWPILGKYGCHAAENVRCQIRNRDPGQYEKSCIVSDETNIAAPRFGAPANVAVPTAQMVWRRTPGQTGDGASLGPGQIF